MGEEVFWAEKVVAEITKEKRKEYVCEGMWSPSGYFHIGNARPEIFTPYAVYLHLKERGFKAKQNFVVDDFDPIDKIPAGIPVKKSEEKNLIGLPMRIAPSPFKGYKTWAEYFESQVTEVVDDFGLELTVQSSFKNYKSGRMNDLILFSLGHSKEIVETWNRIAGTDKPTSFLPVTVVCEKCKKIMFTEALSWDGKKVSYKCKQCGFEGNVSPLDGKAKLHWRVHWVANWIVNNVAFESAGKDHFSKGGSVDVGRALIKDVFNKPVPYQIPTEFVQLKGAKISGSTGNVIDLKEWLSVASPELFRFMFFSYKPNSVIDFSLEDNSFILLNERFERAERIYYGKEDAQNEKIEVKIKKAYELAHIGKTAKKMPLQVPYAFTVQISQLIDPQKQFKKIVALLEQTGHVSGKISKEEENKLLQQLSRAVAWVEKYAPGEFKLSFLEKLSSKETDAMDDSARQLLPGLASKIEKLATPEEIQKEIFETAKSKGVEPKKLFKALYLALTGKDSGPRAGMLIFALGKEKSIKRLQETAA